MNLYMVWWLAPGNSWSPFGKATSIAHNNKKPIIPVRIEDKLPKNLEYLTAGSLFFDAFPQLLKRYLPMITGDIKKTAGSAADKKEKTKKLIWNYLQTVFGCFYLI